MDSVTTGELSNAVIKSKSGRFLISNFVAFSDWIYESLKQELDKSVQRKKETEKTGEIYEKEKHIKRKNCKDRRNSNFDLGFRRFFFGRVRLFINIQ